MENEKFIYELEFALYNNQYKYKCGEIMYKNQYGYWLKLLDLEIDTTNKEFLERCCCYCIQAYYCGVRDGKHERSRELRNLLEIKE